MVTAKFSIEKDNNLSDAGCFRSSFAEGTVEIVLINGKTGERTLFTKEMEASGAVLRTVRQQGKYTEYALEISNTGNDILLLEVRLCVSVSPDGARYWDGWSDEVRLEKGREFFASNADAVEHPAPLRDTEFPEAFLGKKGVEIHRLMGGQFGGPATPLVFPVSGVFRGKNGIAIGVHPDSFHSYFSSGVEPCKGGYSRFYSAVKLVVAAGKSEKVRFVILPFDAREGYRGIIDAYFKAFPEKFTSDPLAPRQFFGPGTTFLYLQAHRWGKLTLEYVRRMLGREVWHWLYAPHQKTGIVDPEEDTFEKEPEAWMTWNHAPEMQGISLKEFRKLLKSAIAVLEPEVPQMSYVILQRCRWSLAEQKYPDAIMRRSDRTANMSPMMRVLTGEGQIITMFAYGNSFAGDMRAGIKRFL